MKRKQRSKGEKGVQHTDIRGKNIPHKGNSKAEGRVQKTERRPVREKPKRIFQEEVRHRAEERVIHAGL